MMSSTALMIYLIILLLMTLGIAWLMEKTKKFLKNGNAWSYGLLAAFYVCLAVLILGVTHIYQPLLFNLLGAYHWVDLVAHVIILWVLQLNADMYIIKKLLKATIENVAKKNGASQEMIDAGEELIRLNG